MNTKINDGGPAFPLQSIGPDFPPGHVCMTLRDWFAGQALNGLLSDYQSVGAIGKTAKEANAGRIATTAEIAYGYADAMLAARLAEQEGNANA
jgi:hypothetical protein